MDCISDETQKKFNEAGEKLSQAGSSPRVEVACRARGP